MQADAFDDLLDIAHLADGNAGAFVTTREFACAVSPDAGIEIELLSFGMHREQPGYMPAAHGHPALAARCSAPASPPARWMPSKRTSPSRRTTSH